MDLGLSYLNIPLIIAHLMGPPWYPLNALYFITVVGSGFPNSPFLVPGSLARDKVWGPQEVQPSVESVRVRGWWYTIKPVLSPQSFSVSETEALVPSQRATRDPSLLDRTTEPVLCVLSA